MKSEVGCWFQLQYITQGYYSGKHFTDDSTPAHVVCLYVEHCIKAAELNTLFIVPAIEHSHSDGWYCTRELWTNAQTDEHAT